MENLIILSLKNVLDESFSLCSSHLPPIIVFYIYIHVFKSSENNPQSSHYDVSQVLKNKHFIPNSKILLYYFICIPPFPDLQKNRKKKPSLPLKHICIVTNISKLSPTQRDNIIKNKLEVKVKKKLNFNHRFNSC